MQIYQEDQSLSLTWKPGQRQLTAGNTPGRGREPPSEGSPRNCGGRSGASAEPSWASGSARRGQVWATRGQKGPVSGPWLWRRWQSPRSCPSEPGGSSRCSLLSEAPQTTKINFKWPYEIMTKNFVTASKECQGQIPNRWRAGNLIGQLVKAPTRLRLACFTHRGIVQEKLPWLQLL